MGDAFARSLAQVPGVSKDRAEAIRKIYPTMADLLEAYEKCEGDEDLENVLLESIPYGESGRNLGPELSKRIARVFCSLIPFMK